MVFFEPVDRQFAFHQEQPREPDLATQQMQQDGRGDLPQIESSGRARCSRARGFTAEGGVGLGKRHVVPPSSEGGLELQFAKILERQSSALIQITAQNMAEYLPIERRVICC
jgi:hypothetical protein